MPKKHKARSIMKRTSNKGVMDEENFADDVICEYSFETEATNTSNNNFNSPINTSINRRLTTVTATKHEVANNSNSITQTHTPSGVIVESLEKTKNKQPERKVIPQEHATTSSDVKPKIEGKTIQIRLTSETRHKQKQIDKASMESTVPLDRIIKVMQPEHATTSDIKPKTDGNTIEIRLTNETRQKEKQTVYRGNSTNIELSETHEKTPSKQTFLANKLVPQQNVLPTVIPYNQNPVYMNPIQNNQQYFDDPQKNQFFPTPPIQPNQFHTQQSYVQTPHVNEPVSFGYEVNEPTSLDVPTFIYPKGIPKSFYQGQDTNILGNSITLNMNAQTPMSPAPQHTFAYTENIPVTVIPSFAPNQETASQRYSPSQIFANPSSVDEDIPEGSNTVITSETGQKRLSAFERLGPMTKPKKPKLTINLMVGEENSVREVVDESTEKENDNKYTPVFLRQDILSSTDPTVLKHIKSWPWKKKINSHKSVTARSSKTVMLLEREQMDEYYGSENFNQVTVKGYPTTWAMEDVLNTVLDSVRECPMIPCFTEFLEEECKFLVYRCRSALLAIHKYGFAIRKQDLELDITISNPDLEDTGIDLLPSTVLKQRLSMCYDGEAKLNLTEFTLKNDIRHFLYFPLYRLCNQTELTRIQNVVIWGFLLELDLSHNRITSIDGFCLSQTTPKLKRLNLSYNLIERITVLLCCKELSLRSIRLEGNPICTDYTDPQHYVKVIKMIFPTVTEIDGLPVYKGKLPPSRNNYCPDEAKSIVEKFLDVYFPLWDAPYDQRGLIKNIYEKKAILTCSFTAKLRYGNVYRLFPELFQRTRMLYETQCESETVEGNKAITKLVKRWPELEHDPFTFKVDVMFHNENATMVRVSGMLKLTTKSLADEEHLVSFIRTVIMKSDDGLQYKINREWVLWDEPREELAKTAFRITTIKTKQVSLEMKSPPNKELKEKLIDIFMQITTIDRKPSKRYLEKKNWHLKHALEYFSKSLKQGDVACLSKD